MRPTRKSYLIKPDFQWKIIGYAAILSAIVLCLVYFAHYFFISSIESMGIEAGLKSDHAFFVFLSEQSSILDSIFLGIAVATNIIIIFGGLWLSNRIAGPIYRVETCLKQINSGKKPQKVSFRKSDFFGELVLALNESIDKISDKPKDPSGKE